MRARAPSKMGRLIERAEFEKRLADYSTSWLRAFKALLQQNAALEARLVALEKPGATGDVTVERVEP